MGAAAALCIQHEAVITAYAHLAPVDDERVDAVVVVVVVMLVFMVFFFYRIWIKNKL